MDFLFGLLHTQNGHDGVWVIVDRLTKTAKFLSIKATYILNKLAKLYMDEIVSSYGTPIFILRQMAMQTHEDMLRASVLELKSSWDTHLPLMEFAYNNNYHSSIEMDPFEALYGRKCRILVCWDEIGKRELVGPELVQMTSENVKLIKEKLKAARDRHKSYADMRRKDLEFVVEDTVFLKLSPWKRVLRFDPSHVLESYPIQLKENLTYIEEPVRIFEKEVQTQRNKTVSLVKFRIKCDMKKELKDFLYEKNNIKDS
ncbi:uncharacterized protein LOC111366820 [Olea europaea var. sylvestris]|uniref:uncharacterized protein LOC111366820 n=1 Tax=Olea europaea var. sylvestris TaxID=158386 RepID=UPI000C1D4E15|nr:uncharacterized protein LOC111366820 [Olea europaea var. sylvestris]